jgi:hypothetical protein
MGQDLAGQFAGKSDEMLKEMNKAPAKELSPSAVNAPKRYTTPPLSGSKRTQRQVSKRRGRKSY